uniref:DUF4774 domain-containing protein n=1 Tax=Anopheles epiroticus TaxID=199890 RepID=A0A182NZT6_9DIPT
MFAGLGQTIFATPEVARRLALMQAVIFQNFCFFTRIPLIPPNGLTIVLAREVLTFATSLLSIQCRPQAIQIEKQVIRLIPESRALEPLLTNQRGSIEETDRILREIERINIAMGYKKKVDVAFPRSGQDSATGYFYPRPAYFPPSVAQLKTSAPQPQKASKGIAPHPFAAQTFFYPAPYLQLPSLASPRAFRLVPVVAAPVVRASKELRTPNQIYILPISVPAADGRSSEIRFIPSTVNFASFTPIQLRGKSLDFADRPRSAPFKKAKGVMEDVAEVADAVQSTKLEEELLEEIAEAVDYEEEEDEKQTAGAEVSDVPAIPNDKFMGAPVKKGETAEEEEDESEPDIELVMLQKVAGKSFNISNVFNNFTHRFNILSTTPGTELPGTVPADTPQDLKDLKEKPLTGEEDLPAQDKGPFGFLATKQADAGSGLVIQRLRVRQGGIAIAGPGGVATAGSGGTAIVGPNGTAITHPRSLTIAGPGAKVYAVPETVDLEKTINATKRSLPLDAVLVANGPVVYYRTFFSYRPAELLLPPAAPYSYPAPGLPFAGRHYSLVSLSGPLPTVETGKGTLPIEDKSPEKLQQKAGSKKRTRKPEDRKKPKRVMNTPVLQALQQPDGRFKLQQYSLAPSEQSTKVISQQTVPVLEKIQRPEAQRVKPQAQSPNPVVVTATGSTTADAPVAGRVPVAPTVQEYYPFYGVPMTDNREEASLILEPSSKAISGNGGTAISTPVSHAILKQGSRAKILFRPQSVAIVGANGRAHAQADLIVDYVNPEHRTATDVLKLPFYGGARGQILEIRKNSDGTVVSKILRGDDEDMELNVQQVAEDVTPVKQQHQQQSFEQTLDGSEEDVKGSDQSFGDYLLKIQNAAASLVSLQETVKKTGKLSPDQRKVYTDNLEKLGVAAQKLAHIQQADDDQDAIRFLFDSNYETTSSGDPQKKKVSSNKITSFPGYKGKEEVKKKEEEENVGEDSSGGDSVQVETQEKESSIAEAKPVGLAIAGEGGVASSKPVATAVVGDGGLAVARPVATAIAGIKPSELGNLGLPISVNKKVLTKGKYGLVAAGDEAAGGVLVGPDFEARVAPKEIEAELEDNRQQAMANFDTEKFLANLRLKTAPTPAPIPSAPQTLASYQPASYLQQTAPYLSDYSQLSQSAYPVYTPTIIPFYNSWTPNYYPYMSTLSANQLAAMQFAQYAQYPYLYGAYQQPQLQQSLAQNPFQQYDYPQRALYNPAPVVSAAAAYPNYNNYASFSSPSPYRFFYY